MTTRGHAPPFSCDVFATIAWQHQAWQNGISPTRKPRGYSGQNPHLIQAFIALDRAKGRAQDYWSKQRR